MTGKTTLGYLIPKRHGRLCPHTEHQQFECAQVVGRQGIRLTPKHVWPHQDHIVFWKGIPVKLVNEAMLKYKELHQDRSS
eukprot:1498822-Ditylum_brightwellii.AAC.2